MTEPVAAPSMPDLHDATWTLLAEDPEDDGRMPGLPDARGLYAYYDAATDTVWFKFDLHQAADTNAFGLNLAVDVDQDQATGVAWWGTNKAFTYDRLVSVWVMRTGSGAFLGTNGVSDARGSQLGWYTHLHRNNVAFRLDETGSALLFGVKRTDLTDGWAMNLIGTVGSNTTWNDDVVDEGMITFDLRVP